MWADRESADDYLNFGEVSQLAVSVISSREMLPISMGIFGNWGAGKSSLLKMIDRDLKDIDDKYLIINFDAWLYQGYDDARASLLEVIVTELSNAAANNQSLLDKTKRLFRRVNKFRLMGLLAEGAAFAAGIPTGGLIARGFGAVDAFSSAPADEGGYENLSKVAVDVYAEKNNILPEQQKNTPPQEILEFRSEYNAILQGIDRPVVIIIDNLDRCLPEHAIQTLEAIRLFLFLNNTAFIIAADEDMIRLAVSEYFKGSTTRHQSDYLDKIIQVPIRVPKAGVREIRAYLFMLYALDSGVSGENLCRLRTALENSLQKSWNEDPITKEEAFSLTGKSINDALKQAYDLADRISPILATSKSINGNPRIVKRLINTVKMRSFIAKKRNIPLDEATITKLVIFERCAGAEATNAFYSLIDLENGRPSILKEIESADCAASSPNWPREWDKSDVASFVLQWGKLLPKLYGVDLRPAIYLSRETMPIGYTAHGLSVEGKEHLKALVEAQSIHSVSARNIVDSILADEAQLIMDELVALLKQSEVVSVKSKGFCGACVLAAVKPHTSNSLAAFIKTISPRPKWLSTILKDQPWFKE